MEFRYLLLGLAFALCAMVYAARDNGRGVVLMNALQMVVLWVYLIVRG